MQGTMLLLPTALLLLWAPQDDLAREKLGAFRKAVAKARADEQVISALEELANMRHPSILKELARHLTGRSEEVRITAARLVGEYAGDKTAATKLAAALGPEAARAKRTRDEGDTGHDVAEAILRAIGSVGRREAATKVHACMEHSNHLLARAAIETAGEVGSLDSVKPLIRLLLEVERGKQWATAPRSNTVKPPPGSVPGLRKLPGRSGEPPPKDDWEEREAIARHGALAPAIQSALEKITGDAQERTGREWQDWWAKNRRRIRSEKK
jgi:HEAT repeat protein